jgi:signal transduction histidine kinase
MLRQLALLALPAVAIIYLVLRLARVAVAMATAHETIRGQHGKLAHMAQAREDHMRAISHDLRTPLAAVSVSAQLLHQTLARVELTERERRGLTAIVAGTRRMDRMICDLVDSLRLEAGQMQLKRTSVDLCPFILELAERLAGPEAVQRIRVHAPDHPLPAWADPDRLERILANLLTNALKYAPADEIIVTLTPRAGEVIISVSDHGPGISPQELPTLFQRYQRTEAGHAHRDGLGLGLYITKGLVEAHGGRIWVESTVGAGSTFSFTLPYPPAAAGAPA